MIAPDSHMSDIIDGRARLISNLAHRSIVVKTCHCRKLAGVDSRRIALCDQGVSIRRITDNQNFDVFRSIIIQRLTLS